MSAVFVFTTYGGPQGQQLTEREAPHAAVRRDRHRGSRRRREPRRLEAPGRRLRHARVRAGRDGPGSGRGRDRRGGGVEHVAVGDEVLGAPARGLGAFAEHTVLKAAETVSKPEEISFADAATIPIAGTTAYDLTHQVELEAGQTLLVLGAGGGVGHMALQIAKVRQFRAIGIASDSKCEL